MKLSRCEAWGILFCVCACALLAMTGCEGGGGKINAAAIDAPLRMVVSEHRTYVQDDAAKSEMEKTVRYDTLDLLIRVLDEAKASGEGGGVRGASPPPL